MRILAFLCFSLFILYPGIGDMYSLPKLVYLSLIVTGSLIGLWVRRGPSGALPLAFPATIWLLISALSGLKAVSGYEYLRQVGLDMLGIGIFWCTVNFTQRREVNSILRRTVRITAIFSITSIFLYLLQSGWDAGGLMGNTEFAAMVVSVVLPVSFYVALSWWDLLSPCLLLLHLVLLRFNGAWLGLGGAVFIWLMIRSKRWVFGVFFLSVAVFIFSSFFLSSLSVQNRMLWSLNSTAMIAEHPLLGIGRGNWALVYPRYAKTFGDNLIGTYQYYNHPAMVNAAHNDYIQIWAETGTLGIAAFTLLIGALLRSFQPDQRSGFLFIGIVTLLVEACVTFPFQLPVSVAFFWLLAGLYWVSCSEKNNS